MNRTVIFALALVLLGASGAPTALITGSVRDQSGAPIQGAEVRASYPTIGPMRSDMPGVSVGYTAADGTFALEAPPQASIWISCRFCQPTVATVAADGTVVAIVRRFTALLQPGPSSDDIAALPYAYIESDLALTPFVQLNDSASILPGPQLSDRGSQRGGGLLLDAGIPNYDVVANVSSFDTIPQHYVQAATAAPQSEAYRYGDLADGGIYAIDAASEYRDAFASTGADAALRVGTSNDTTSFSAGLSNNREERRERADGSLRLPAFDGTFGVDATISSGRTQPDDYDDLWASYAAAHASFERTQAFTLRADAYLDRGTYYAETHEEPLRSEWSDAGASVTVRSNAVVAPFATLAVRSSTGFYDAEEFGIARFGASVGQAQMSGGVRASGAWYDALAAIGSYDAAYSGGVYGLNFPGNAHMTAPVVRVHLHPGDRWSLTASASGGFLLPTLLDRYSIEPPYESLGVDRDATHEATLSYDDGSRVQVGLTGLQRYVSGVDSGRIAGAGASFAWQLAPTISVRSWWMRSTPNLITTQYGTIFGVHPHAANTGSVWLTYENPGALRLDAIWRQDLIDFTPDAHWDASVSGPLARSLRWYVGSERRLGVRYTDVGLRFAEL